MPVDWRILNIEKEFLACLNRVENKNTFFNFLINNMKVNVLWMEGENGLVLFDRANNRGIRLKWHELFKIIISSAIDGEFQPPSRTSFEEFWYFNEVAAGLEFSELILNTVFIRYSKIDPAEIIAELEDELDADRFKQDDLNATAFAICQSIEKIKASATTLVNFAKLRQT